MSIKPEKSVSKCDHQMLYVVAYIASR